MALWRSFLAAAAFCALTGSGLATAQVAPSGPAAAQATMQAPTPVVPPSAAPDVDPVAAQGYVLGSGDHVRVTVFGETQLSGEFVVSGSGDISMPLIGDRHATGLTTAQLGGAIAASLRGGYLLDPKVSVDLTASRPFYIYGEVKQPGEYPFTPGLTVLNAVARAQGFTYRANQRRVFIKHAGQDRFATEPLTSGILVAPGDTVRIGERYF